MILFVIHTQRPQNTEQSLSSVYLVFGKYGTAKDPERIFLAYQYLRSLREILKILIFDL